MKKILLIHNRYKHQGGEDVAVKNEVALLEQNFKVEVIYFDNNLKNLLNLLLSFIFNLNRNSQKILRKKIKEFNPDYAYVHNTWFKASLGIFRTLDKEKVPIILKIHNFRYFCTRSFLSKNHFLDKNICQACGADQKNFKNFNKYFQNSILKSLFVIRYGKKYFKILKNEKIKILVLTKFHQEFLKNLTNRQTVNVFQNYLKTDLANRTNQSAEKFIVYAGRISSEKGVKELIKTFRDINDKNLKLKIIGDGPQLKELKKSYKFDNIEFLGELENTEVLSLISSSIGVVSATKLYEGQPTLLCEASKLGIPSIFPRTGGIGEFFPDNYELSFEQFNYEDLKNKIKLLSDEKLRLNIGENNKSFIDTYLDRNSLTNKFKKILNE